MPMVVLVLYVHGSNPTWYVLLLILMSYCYILMRLLLRNAHDCLFFTCLIRWILHFPFLVNIGLPAWNSLIQQWLWFI